MKKLFNLSLFFFFILSSCSKTSNLLEKVDESALNIVMSYSENNKMRAAYGLLNPREKQELWIRHINYFIRSRELTSEQLSFVLSFRNEWIVKNLFEKNSLVYAKFHNALPNIKENAQLILGVGDAFALLTDLSSDRKFYTKTSGDFQQFININGEPVELPPSTDDCSCSQTDSYCNVGSCKDNGCKKSSFGCGTLWLFSCNGVCSLL